MDFWKKVVQIGQKVLGKEDYKNPQNLSKEFCTALTQYLDQGASIDPILAAELARFVIDDDDEQCLLKLRANPEFAGKLGFEKTGHWFYANNKERLRLSDARFDVPGGVWQRVGKLYTAAAGQAALSQARTQPCVPDWFAVLLSQFCALEREVHRLNPKEQIKIDPEKLTEILRTENLSEKELILTLLDSKQTWILSGGVYSWTREYPDYFKDLDKFLNRNNNIIKDWLVASDAETRCAAIWALSANKFDFKTIDDLIVGMATGTSKTVREEVLSVLRTDVQHFRPLIEHVMKNGPTAERNEAVSVLYRLCGTDCLPALEAHLPEEKSDRVKQTIQRYISTPESVEIEVPIQQQVALPTENTPISKELVTALQGLFDDAYKVANQNYNQALAQWNAPTRPKWMREPKKPEPFKSFDRFMRYVETGESASEFQVPIFVQNTSPATTKKLYDVASPEAINFLQFVRMLNGLKILTVQHHGNEDHLGLLDATLLKRYMELSSDPLGLREFDAAVATLPGGKPGLVGHSYVFTYRWNNFDFPDDKIWPLFAERADLIVKAFQPDSTHHSWYWGSAKSIAFRILAMFPQLPNHFVSMLWDIALGDVKTDRRSAQDALNTVPGKLEKIVSSLGDGNKNVRSAAAEWLGRMGDSRAIEPLKVAFKKEKTEQAKGVIMHALDSLGADVDEFLNRDQLLKEAESLLKKNLPKGMEWVPIDSLPKLHWSDSGAEVDPSIPKYWIVQSIQQKQPICGPVLRRYLQMCKKSDATAFARFVLSSWISRDTSTISHEDAVAVAKVETAKQIAAYGKQEWFIKAHKGDPENNLFKAVYAAQMQNCLYSAIDQKGMLAIVSAAGDSNCVKVSEAYIRKWYGMRSAQCKSLIDVLAWIDHPLALQSLLSFANRFRTKGIKELAAEHVTQFAERKGWTIDELADRTIPDAGFERPVDETGQPIGDAACLELDFGPRQFTVSLNDKLEPVVYPKGEDKALKALPTPGKADDEELAKEAKKEFADAKKVAKEVVKRQSERLYEALCTQRTWRFEDWDRYLAKHPIVGKLCVKIGWVAFDAEGKLLSVFRPLEDGSLTNENDEEVTLPADALVKVAHSCNVPAKLAEAWAKHLKDYDVEPLFEQFTRPVTQLTDEQLKATEITDFIGHMISTFKLRARATKLGFVRGEAEDGGSFFVYRKTFTSLQLQAVLEFTGSYLPEEDIPASLRELRFVSVAGRGESRYSMSGVPLSKVPLVLISEVYNDVKRIAADGSGFDPKWQEKAYM